MLPVTIGPDGFWCAHDRPNAEFHSALNELLQAQAKEPAKAHAIAGAGVKRLRSEYSDKDMISLTLAAAERVIANGELGEESAKTTEWRCAPYQRSVSPLCPAAAVHRIRDVPTNRQWSWVRATDQPFGRIFPKP
jgi:hypothetical protein